MVLVETMFAMLVVGCIVAFGGIAIFHAWKRYNARLTAEDEWAEEAWNRFHKH